MRSSGVTACLPEKILFARQLERLNVDVIEIGYRGPEEAEPMRELTSALIRSVVLRLARVNLEDVKREDSSDSEVGRGAGERRRPRIRDRRSCHP
jgi:isopropylmalate/homocitrate/citramalate synthase